MRRSNVFSTIFALLIVFLMVMPFLLTFNESLTRFVEKFRLYSALQEFVVPIQVQVVTLLVRILGIKAVAHVNGFEVNGTYLVMTWNCVGWQSLLLFAITLYVGFKNGAYTLWSKVETVVIGILGTFLVNIVRLTVIVVIFAYLRPIYGIVYHDYLAALVTAVWLFVFWWFSYKYVLQDRKNKILTV